MKVWELREQLQACQDDDLVIVNDEDGTAVLCAERKQIREPGSGHTFPAVVMYLAGRPGKLTR